MAVQSIRTIRAGESVDIQLPAEEGITIEVASVDFGEAIMVENTLHYEAPLHADTETKQATINVRFKQTSNPTDRGSVSQMGITVTGLTPEAQAPAEPEASTEQVTNGEQADQAGEPSQGQDPVQSNPEVAEGEAGSTGSGVPDSEGPVAEEERPTEVQPDEGVQGSPEAPSTETQLSVSVSSNPIIVGDSVLVTITTDASDYTVNELNTEVATYDKSSKTITCHKEGSARFVFRATADTKTEKIVNLDIEVKQYVSLTIVPERVTVRQNETSIDLLINTNADAVIAEVEDKTKASYDDSTKRVTGLLPGSTRITFTGYKSGKVEKSVVVPVDVLEEVIYKPTLLTSNTSVVGGEVLDIRFSTPQVGATLSARIDNEELGELRAVGDTVYFESKAVAENKLANIYVKTVKDGKESEEVSLTVLITVRNKTSITIEGPTTLKVGELYDYRVVTEASSFVIESDNPDLAAVADDKILAKAPGEVTISARATAANKMEGIATITVNVVEKVKGTKPALLTDPSRLTLERSKELVLEFQIKTGEKLVGEVDPALGSINVVNNTATIYILPAVQNDTVPFRFRAISTDNIESEPLDVTVNVNKLRDMNPVVVTPLVNKIKIEENMSYEVLMETAIPKVSYKLSVNPASIADVNTQTMTIIGRKQGDGHVVVVATAEGYDTNIINIPITVTEDPDDVEVIIPGLPDISGVEEITESQVETLMGQKGVSVRDKLDTIKKKGPAAFKAIVNKLDSYNEQMNPETSSLTNKQCANKNFELYTMLKNATNVSDNSSFKLRFDLINLYFKEYKNEAFDEFALFRADDAWTWGQNSLQTYQNLITIITSLCDITTRANNIRTIDVPKTINDINSDLTQLSKQNIIGYYTV